MTHIPNHVEVSVLKVSDDHSYEASLINKRTFPGYGCESAFCEWLFHKDNAYLTVIAHNGAGYDNKFILQWCLRKGLEPEAFIRQGSRITFMTFKKFKLRFIDSLHFFLEPLKNLSKTYSLEPVKGHFPHHFNRPENQEYIDPIPDEDMFGVKNMSSDYYEKDFKPWYDSEKDRTDWNFLLRNAEILQA